MRFIAGGWEGPSTSVPVELEYFPLLVWMCLPAGRLAGPPSRGFMDMSSVRHDQSVSFAGPLPSLEKCVCWGRELRIPGC